MNKIYLKSAFTALLFSASSALFSQNVSMNLSGINANQAAILDLSGNPNLGFLMPTVTLTNSTLAIPISSPPAGLIVYNSSNSTSNGLLGAGFYYWSGSQWLYLINSGSSQTGDNGATSYVARWTGGTSLGTGVTQDNGTGVGISAGAITPQSLLDINGGVAIGSYAGNTAAPSNGLVISGNVGIGTSSPNAAAALDISSSTQGVLIPRMASNPTSTSLGVMYYNTTTNCFVFWTGTAWQNMFCTCLGTPSVPGSINGVTSYCPNATGISYSISSISNAVNYTWTVPSDATITSGQGSTGITVNFGTSSGNVSVTANNSCGASSAASTLAVTADTLPTISVQPTGAGVGTSGSGTAYFTVTAIGAGLTYQWQVNSGSGWSALSNGGIYSGVTTDTLIITNPTTAVSGYQYDCVVTGTCPPGTTSNAATLVVGIPSVPIIITNTQSTATPNNFVQMITVNSSSYSGYNESGGLQNVEFTTAASGGGTPLYAWIESGATNASASTVYWVNLGASIGASSTYTIYMNFMPTTIMSSTTSYTGEAPQLFGTGYLATSYGQYDNGAKVFSAYFNGNTPTTSFTYGSNAGVMQLTTDASFEGTTNFPASSPINVVNFTPNGASGGDAAYIYSAQALPVTTGQGYIGETSLRIAGNTGSAIGVVGFFDGTSGTPKNSISVGTGFYSTYLYESWIINNANNNQNPGSGLGSGAPTTPIYGSILWTGTLASSYYAYLAPQLYSITTPGTGYSESQSVNPLSAATNLYLGIHVNSQSNDGDVNTNWMRARPNPPNNTSSNNTMPTITFGSVIP